MNYGTGVKQSKLKKTILILAAVLCGTLINLAGSRAAAASNLPVFCDSIGTVLSAALCGYIPGILTGFITNIINGLTDYTSAYYGVINMLIAVAAAWFSHQGYFKKLKKLPLAILVLALIGGGIGSVLTWFLFGSDFGTGISAPLAHSIYNGGLSNVFLAQLSADLLIDLLDKTITVVLAAIVLHILPARVLDALNIFSWRNDSPDRIHPKDERAFRTMSLGSKIILLIALAVLIISVGVTFISFHQFHDAALENQYVIGESISRVAASFIDGNRVPDYIKYGSSAEGYLETKGHLYSIMKSSPDIAYVYAYKIKEDGCHVVFDLDTDDLPGEAPGTVIEFDTAFEGYLDDLLEGREIEPVISDETYGWLLTFYRPVYDDAGVCQCYAAVDISMPRIIANEQIFMTRTISLFFSFFILLLTAGVFFARHYIVQPINGIARVAQAFAYNSEEARQVSLERLRKLNINTGDEIENLYDSYLKTTEDTVRYITEVQEQTEKISKLQNGLIMVLADVVESRDKCTGDHIKNTASYARIIMEQMIKEGVCTEILTKEYMQDVENSAPLHDVGKIQVPDAILNKPGRLTEEEFALMKTHTTKGSEIIQHAIQAVSESESGYLKEAKNLAEYHHERWDGKGYPKGLAGEQIPLSARIMAVADVFDALVSKRSYKEGFPFEKAIGIIREGVGTQFDPRIAGAFLDAQEEIRKVAETHKDHEA
ncbi:MAG: HD domain-containing protein [Clostridia bacterium]|nr:HD domain-containing protein [Clostridia bacterium]